LLSAHRDCFGIGRGDEDPLSERSSEPRRCSTMNPNRGACVAGWDRHGLFHDREGNRGAAGE
jgi:hypothetical protein